jgi:hypothetical protein
MPPPSAGRAAPGVPGRQWPFGTANRHRLGTDRAAMAQDDCTSTRGERAICRCHVAPGTAGEAPDISQKRHAGRPILAERDTCAASPHPGRPESTSLWESA